MKRRKFITLLGGAMATWPLIAHTQQAMKTLQIGVLSLGRGDKSDASLTTLNAFMPALADLGYTEGRILPSTENSQMATRISSTDWRRNWLSGGAEPF